MPPTIINDPLIGKTVKLDGGSFDIRDTRRLLVRRLAAAAQAVADATDAYKVETPKEDEAGRQERRDRYIAALNTLHATVSENSYVRMLTHLDEFSIHTYGDDHGRQENVKHEEAEDGEVSRVRDEARPREVPEGHEEAVADHPFVPHHHLDRDCLYTGLCHYAGSDCNLAKEQHPK